MKLFEYKTVATVVSDLLFDDLDKVHDLVSYMTGQSVTRQNIEALARVCRSYFLSQYPALRQLNFEECSPYYYDCYDADFNDILGAYVPVEPYAASIRQAA